MAAIFQFGARIASAKRGAILAAVADIFTKLERSRIMSRIRSRGNKGTELILVALFRAAGVKGWRRHLRMLGRPDFVFAKQRVAVFVDGCFWHGCAKHCRMPSSNRKYWLAKIERNQGRDLQTRRALRAKGWKVVRIWEHELKARPAAVVRKVTRAFPAGDSRARR
jgi:DNA mismatch endonuclease (patch repair protein)